jgi:hypothetical protein
MYPTNPYPPAAPASMDPRFLGWQQIYPGANSPYNHVASPVVHGSHLPTSGPAVTHHPGAEHHPAAAPALRLPSPPVPAARPIEVLPPLPTAPASAPAVLPAAKPAGISLRSAQPARERTIDIIPDGRKGGWRVSNGPR